MNISFYIIKSKLSNSPCCCYKGEPCQK